MIDGARRQRLLVSVISDVDKSERGAAKRRAAVDFGAEAGVGDQQRRRLALDDESSRVEDGRRSSGGRDCGLVALVVVQRRR